MLQTLGHYSIPIVIQYVRLVNTISNYSRQNFLEIRGKFLL